MTEAELAARGQRAEHALTEFFDPVIDDYRAFLMDRMATIARNELDSRIMADKQRNLAVSLKVVDEIAQSLRQAVSDGKYARDKLIQIRKVEEMTPARQRMLNIAPRNY